MDGPRSAEVPAEGTVFALPLTSGELMLGVVIRRYPEVARIGLLPDPVTELPDSPPPVTTSALGVLTQVRSDALDEGEWPIVGTIEGFDPDEWPEPPILPGEDPDKAETPESLQRDMERYVRQQRLRTMRDATWVAENPHLADPLVGTRYMKLPAERILQYVEERVSWCGLLGAVVLERAPLEEGTFISTLPEEVGVDEAVREPDGGGRHADRGRGLIRGHLVHPDGTREPVYDSRLSALTMVSEWLTTGDGHLLVFRDPVSDRMPSDLLDWQAARYEARGGWVMWSGRDRYVMIPPGAAMQIVTSTFLSERMVGFLTDHGGGLDGRDRLTDRDLDELADGLEGIVVGSYDGEGYVVWTRTHGDRWLVG